MSVATESKVLPAVASFLACAFWLSVAPIRAHDDRLSFVDDRAAQAIEGAPNWYLGTLQKDNDLCVVLSLPTYAKLKAKDFLPHVWCKQQRNWAVVLSPENGVGSVKLVYRTEGRLPHKLFAVQKKKPSGDFYCVSESQEFFRLSSIDNRYSFEPEEAVAKRSDSVFQVVVDSHFSESQLAYFRKGKLSWAPCDSIRESEELEASSSGILASDNEDYVTVGKVYGEDTAGVYSFSKKRLQISQRGDLSVKMLPAPAALLECVKEVQSIFFDWEHGRFKIRSKLFEDSIRYSKDRDVLVFLDPAGESEIVSVCYPKREAYRLPTSGRIFQYELISKAEGLYLFTSEFGSNDHQTFKYYELKPTGATEIGEWAEEVTSEQLGDEAFRFLPLKLNERWCMLLVAGYTTKGKRVETSRFNAVQPSISLIKDCLAERHEYKKQTDDKKKE